MRKLSLFLLLLTAVVTSAQNSIRGKVIDENNHPIIGAVVTLKQLSKSITTDTNGEFSFENLTDYAYSLQVKSVGFETYEEIVKNGSVVTLQLNRQAISLEEVTVSATRAGARTPVAYSSMEKSEIEERNLGQDIPFLINYLPSVINTSDAGAGVGYTGIRVRGSDATRVNITINGIPYNDSESQGSFLVNIPDFASSVQNLQLQRGVGTSTNGAAAFGASLNMLTDVISPNAYAEISNSYGSFNTRKHTLKASTGLLNNSFEINGRVSQIASDGYIDRAFSNLKSYFLQGTYYQDKTLIKALTFGGAEKTYQAWNGIDLKTLETNRKYNPAGEYVDANGETKYYDNETDNYNQKHYQLHWNQQWSGNWTSHAALHYTRGKGYYENYITGQYSDFGLAALPLQEDGSETKAGIIRQKWLDNHFYGMVFSVNYTSKPLDIILGGGLNKYDGDHYGKILWTEMPRVFDYNQKFYDNSSMKSDINFYAKATYRFLEKWSLFADMQYRRVHYKVERNWFEVDDVFPFFNPKAGVTYEPNDKNNFYFSYGMGHREPNRYDYENNEIKPRPEQLNDFELGWRFRNTDVLFNANIYYMLYIDQLVLTGKLDEVGSPIRTNSGKSYRAGLELDAQIKFNNQWSVRPNVTVSQNKNVDYYITDDAGELKNLGNTNISFSPNVIAGNMLTYSPLSNLQLSVLSKYVGKQYLTNEDIEESALKAYFVNDFNANYEIKMDKVLRSVNLALLVNNLLNTKYVSNGAWWGEPYYYPQAGINVLGSVTLKF